MTLSVIDMLGRLAVAGLLGAAIGLEREIRQHPAGVRTHALVAVGACLFTMAGAYAFTDVSLAATDPSRVAAQVATGIGFIGAGAILRTGEWVRGLTTAATLWFTAALGVTVGAGGYVAALVSAAVVFAILIGMRFLKRWLPGYVQSVVEVEYQRGHGTLGPLLRELERVSSIQRMIVDDDEPDTVPNDGTRRVLLELVAHDEADLAQSCERLATRPEVVSIVVRRGRSRDRGTTARPGVPKPTTGQQRSSTGPDLDEAPPVVRPGK